MRSFSRSNLAPREQERSEQKPLQFRKVALLYPAKDVLERIRRDGHDVAPSPNHISPMFDEDNGKNCPLAQSKDVRVIIAQDDTGASLDRLLFDSNASNGSRNDVVADVSNFVTKSSSSTQSSGHSETSTIRQASPKDSRNRFPTLGHAAKSDGVHESSSHAAFFGQSQHTRRTAAHGSLADGKADGKIPIEDTKDEMDSWLDCVFGKTQMRYKGGNTKLHILQRQPLDVKLAQGEKEPHGGGCDLCTDRRTPLPKSRSNNVLQKSSALLISRTFIIPVHNEDLPEPLREEATSAHQLSLAESDAHRIGHATKIHCATPTFGVAVLLPLDKSQVDVSSVSDPIQLAIDNWRTITRAIDALEASAASHIQRQLKLEVEAMAKRYSNRLPTSRRILRLKSSALQASGDMAEVSESVSARIARSFRILDVSTRSEWNIWRDELRDSSRSGRGSDATRVSFIQLVLTAALSSNLSWMRIFAPPQLQTRLHREARLLRNAYDEAQNRTVVTTMDHNTARQVIYILAKFMPIAEPPAQFVRSPTTSKAPERVSALTQGLKAVGQHEHNNTDYRAASSPAVSFGNNPVFNLPQQSSPGTSPVKYASIMAAPKSRSPSKSSIQRMKSRIDIEAKATPAMPIASAPGSSYTTPTVSPEVRPGSSAGASGDLMRHLQRNNSALSETSNESGSFWSSLRSASWNWSGRRESGTTSGSEGMPGMSASQRGDGPAGILKTAKTSLGRSSGRKLVRMVEEAEELHMPPSVANTRHDSALPTPTLQAPTSRKGPPAAFSRILEYTYDASQGVVDVQQLGTKPNAKSCKIPVSSHRFPSIQSGESAPEEHASSSGDAGYDKVAGYLDRMHPDYALQAVKPYQDLEAEIKRAMQGERSPKHGNMFTEPHFFPIECWVDVCSTILIDADKMKVKRLSLRRRIRYSMNTQDEAPCTNISEAPPNAIKVTKSDEMETVKRTYRRNDTGTKIDWKDKRIVPSDSGSTNSSMANSLANSYEHIDASTSGATIRQPVLNSGAPAEAVPAKTQPNIHNSNASLDKPRQHNGRLGDDLTAFIDEKAKANNKPKPQPTVTALRRVAIRNKEGKITGWKDVDIDEPEEPGLYDLPATFVNRKQEKVMPVIHERVLEEIFEEEFISKPDQAIVSLLEQMITSSEPRSAAPSRAGSMHERTHSRSNSICGSGLTELQHESKKIVENVLQGLVTSVVSEKHSPPRPSGGGFLGFGRGSQTLSETSILRQSISKWLNEG